MLENPLPITRTTLVAVILVGLLVVLPSISLAAPPDGTSPSGLPSLHESAGLSEYLTYAALTNPGLEASFHHWQAAVERIEQVGVLPDPTVSYGLFIEQVETRVGPQEQKLAIAQAFPWLSKLRLRTNVASETARAAEQNYQATKLRVFYQVKDAFYELYYLARAIAITEDNIALLKHLESVAQVNFMVGAPVSGVIKAQVELGKLDDRLRTLEDLRGPVVAGLNAALGRPTRAPVPWPMAVAVRDITFDDRLVLASLGTKNPQLLRLDHEIARDQQSIELARKDFRPNFMVGLDWVDTSNALVPGVPGSGTDPLVAKVSITVPIWRSKYRAGVREAEKRSEATRGRRADVQNALGAKLELALFRFHDAERKIELYRDTLLPLAEASLEVAQVGYEAGKEGFLELIDAQRLLLEFQLAYERGVADREQRTAEIEMLIAQPLASSGTEDSSNPKTGA